MHLKKGDEQPFNDLFDRQRKAIKNKIIPLGGYGILLY